MFFAKLKGKFFQKFQKVTTQKIKRRASKSDHFNQLKRQKQAESNLLGLNLLLYIPT